MLSQFLRLRDQLLEVIAICFPFVEWDELDVDFVADEAVLLMAHNDSLRVAIRWSHEKVNALICSDGETEILPGHSPCDMWQQRLIWQIKEAIG